MGAGVASRAGVSAHDLLRSGEPRVGGGRARGEEEEEAEEEGTESKRGDVDISSVTLEECDGLRRGRRTMPTFFFVRQNIPSTVSRMSFPSFLSILKIN